LETNGSPGEKRRHHRGEGNHDWKDEEITHEREKPWG